MSRLLDSGKRSGERDMNRLKALVSSTELSGAQRDKMDKALKHVPSLKERAYHEAGHVVAALALDIPFSSITVIPEKGGKVLGRLNHFDRRKTGRRLTDLDERYLILDLSGPLSARKARMRTGPYIEHEIVEALKICGGGWTLTGRTPSRGSFRVLPEELALGRMSKLFEFTKEVLDLHWDEVKLIANALLKEKTLTKHRVMKLLNKLPQTR